MKRFSALLLLLLVPVILASMGASDDTSSNSKQLRAARYDRSRQLVISRRNTQIRRDPPTSGTTHTPYAAGSIIGVSSAASILAFDSSVTGELVKSEEYNSGKISYYWDEDNTQVDNTLKASLFGVCRDFEIQGDAQLADYPYSVSGAHGTGFTPYADGLCVQGTGWELDRLAFFQVPGKALVMHGGGGGHAGPFCSLDNRANRATRIFVQQCYSGPYIDASDSRLENIEVVNVVTDGAYYGGAGMHVTDSHIYGADRGCVVSGLVHGDNWYHEAARIGTQFLFGSDGSWVNGLYIGPATCWSRGVLIGSDFIKIRDLEGIVMAEGTDGHSDIVGAEIGASRAAIKILDAQVTVGTGSVGVKLGDASHHNTITIQPTTSVDGSIGVQVGNVYATKVECHDGYIPGGAAIDLSGSNLNSVDGQGNVFDVSCSLAGSGKAIKYPGGGTVFNLAVGNHVILNGVETHRRADGHIYIDGVDSGTFMFKAPWQKVRKGELTSPYSLAA